MIRLDEVEKILIRLGKYKNLTNMKTSNKNLNDELFPLRGVLFCPECEKKCTGRASKSGTGELHYYYGCNNKHCKIYKKSLKKDQLHEEMKQLIKHITPPEKILILIEKIFDTIRNEKKYLQKDILRKRKQEIKKIEEKLQQIQNKMLVIENTQLLKAMDNDRTNLNEEKNQIEEQLSYDPL
jgi:hypothetical protein